MIYTSKLNGLDLVTGDVLCTRNGTPEILPGEFWRLIGRLVPGEVDHVAVYLGPGGRCIESGARGVLTFEFRGPLWDSQGMADQRGFFDQLIGAAYPLAGRDLSQEEEREIRVRVASFCLGQVGKPYNLNFLDPDREDAFYCSQLVYQAYRHCGFDLNTHLAVTSLPETHRIIFPQELWSSLNHRPAPSS